MASGIFYRVADGGMTKHGRYFTIGHKILNIEAASGIVVPEMYRVLDRVIDRARARLKGVDLNVQSEDEAEKILNEIDDALTDENFIYPSWGYVDTLAESLTPVELDTSAFSAAMATYENENRKQHLNSRGPGVYYVADCDTLSFIYLSVADALKLPLRILERSATFDKDPGHNFIRWQLPGGTSLDWETMTGERRDTGQGFVLSDGQLSGYILRIVGDQWIQAGSYSRAILAYRAAIAHGYETRGILNQAAWFLATVSDPSQRDAVAARQYAIRLCSQDPTPNEIDTCAAAAARSGNFAEAVDLEEKAIAGTAGDASKARMRDRLVLYQSRRPYTLARRREQLAIDKCDDVGDLLKTPLGERCPDPLYKHYYSKQ
jgi:hypothetical protein